MTTDRRNENLADHPRSASFPCQLDPYIPAQHQRRERLRRLGAVPPADFWRVDATESHANDLAIGTCGADRIAIRNLGHS